ncbi:MAG TPA: hypothetical protein PLY52_11760 [Methanothrix sp.]|nr:hypothetical protein [Euryarchaeota archaeon]HON36965.1 hypothetical protein [Methanothrix sp.]
MIAILAGRKSIEVDEVIQAWRCGQQMKEVERCGRLKILLSCTE